MLIRGIMAAAIVTMLGPTAEASASTHVVHVGSALRGQIFGVRRGVLGQKQGRD
jgi:hypothetical protein